MLFGKKNKNPVVSETPSCCCQASAPVPPAPESAAPCCPEAEAGICCIKVLGMGCKSCEDQFHNVISAAANMGLAVAIDHVTDLEQIMSYGVMQMPAIVVNERVVSMGKVLSIAEVETLLRRF